MADITRSGSWREELAGLVDDGIMYSSSYGEDQFISSAPSDMDPFIHSMIDSEQTHFDFDSHLASMDSKQTHYQFDAHLPPQPPPTSVDNKQIPFSFEAHFEGERREQEHEEDLKEQIKGFAKAWGELLLDLSRGCKDVVQQNLVTEDSYFVQKFGPPFTKVSTKLKFLNEYLPEDRDPLHAWPVIFFVFLLALAALNVNSAHDTVAPVVKQMVIHTPGASTILLPDGRHMAYREEGVAGNRARYTLIAPHAFLSSRLAGIPGIKVSLLEEFGVQLVTYDLPGFGESDPHPSRDLNSSALDLHHLANALGIYDKFWVLGYSTAAMHAWASLKYISNRIAGAAFVAPMVNPYESSMTKEEMSKAWDRWERKRKFMFSVARRFPSFLPYIYRQSFLSGKHGKLEEWFSLSLSEKDKALVKTTVFEEFWQRDVEESVRQGHIKPFIEEAVLQVSEWGFRLTDLQIRRRCPGKGFLPWLKSIYSLAECELTGYAGPIHIWQGSEDHVVPSSMARYIARILPGATLHQLPSEGHFSYLFFCDECHRDMLSTLFGTPLGPLDNTNNTSNTDQSSANQPEDGNLSSSDTAIE